MPLFGFGRRQAPAPAARQFRMTNEFEYIFQLMLMMCASDYGNDMEILVTAKKGGQIDLRVVGNISYFSHMLREVDPSVERFFCSPAHYSGSSGYGSMRFTFNEPDCYIYGCPEGPFQSEVSEYAPNGNVTSFRKDAAGNLSVNVKFSRQSDDEVYQCFMKLKQRCAIWLS